MAKQAATSPTHVNIVAEDTVLEGTLRAEGDVRISGRLVGTLAVRSRLVVTPEGAVDGEVAATYADIAGSVQGELEIDECLVLRSQASVEGIVRTGRLVIEEGASFNGQCQTAWQGAPRKQAAEAGAGVLPGPGKVSEQATERPSGVPKAALEIPRPGTPPLPPPVPPLEEPPSPEGPSPTMLSTLLPQESPSWPWMRPMLGIALLVVLGGLLLVVGYFGQTRQGPGERRPSSVGAVAVGASTAVAIAPADPALEDAAEHTPLVPAERAVDEAEADRARATAGEAGDAQAEQPVAEQAEAADLPPDIQPALRWLARQLKTSIEREDAGGMQAIFYRGWEPFFQDADAITAVVRPGQVHIDGTRATVDVQLDLTYLDKDQQRRQHTRSFNWTLDHFNDEWILTQVAAR